MSFSGVHIECGRTGPINIENQSKADCLWSEYFTDISGQSVNLVPASQKPLILTITSSIDIFYDIGVTPNANGNTKRVLLAGYVDSIFVSLNQKFAFIVA